MSIDRGIKRSSKSKYTEPPENHAGVGARQEDTPVLRCGGGYLDNCTNSELLEELKIAELKSMGIGSVWLGVAEIVGVSQFLNLWRYLDSCESGVEHNSQVRVAVPRFSTFQKYQRNQFIRTLSAAGETPANIQTALSKQHSINVHIRTVERVIGKHGKSHSSYIS